MNETKSRIQSEITRRKVLRYGGGLALAAGASLAAPAIIGARAQTPKPVTLTFQWFASGAYAGYFLAKERGFYTERGLDVTFKHVMGNALALQQLVASNTDFIHADFIQMLQLHGTDPKIHLRAVGVIAEKLALSLFYLKGRGIEEPKDLEGRTIVDSPGSTAPLIFKMFAEANGIDPAKVNWTSAAGAAKVAVMLQEQADAVAIYLNSRPSILAKLQPGQEIGWFTFGERGANIYGDGMITTDKYLQENRETAEAFVQASARGFEVAFEDLEAGVDPIVKAAPELKKEIAVKELEIAREVAIGPAQKQHGIGYIEPEKMKASYDAVVNLLGSKITRPVEDLFMNLV
jgi:NitT/TauT family transport system substrate-binding protein